MLARTRRVKHIRCIAPKSQYLEEASPVQLVGIQIKSSTCREIIIFFAQSGKENPGNKQGSRHPVFIRVH